MNYSSSATNMTSLNNYHDLRGLQKIKNEPDQVQALKTVAKQFESLFTHELLKSMRKANEAFEQHGMFNSSESKHFRDMYDQQMSLQLSSGRGLGIADILYKQLSSRFENTPQEASATSDNSDELVDDVSARTLAAPTSNTVDMTPLEDDAQQAPLNRQNFVERLLPIAQKIASSLPVNPMVLLAQSALETGWGQHTLKAPNGQDSYNLFNIKAGSDWRGETVARDVLEYKDGVAVKEKSNFRKYTSFEESFADFKDFLLSQPRYGDSLSADNEQAFVVELQKAGYATDPHYADKVLDIYQRIMGDNSAIDASP